MKKHIARLRQAVAKTTANMCPPVSVAGARGIVCPAEPRSAHKLSFAVGQRKKPRIRGKEEQS